MNRALPVDAAKAAPPEREREIDAERLVGPAGVVRIRLGGTLYVLRITRQGKLLLTK